jgi:hypothetical protein
VGRRATGRIFREAVNQSEAAEALAHMTDNTGYYIFTRSEWENETASPYEEAQLQLQKIIEAWDDINLRETLNNFRSNPRIKRRMVAVANQIRNLAQEVDVR